MVTVSLSSQAWNVPSSYLGGVQQRDQYPPHAKMVKAEWETELEEEMVLSKIWTRKCLPYDQFVSLRTIMYFPRSAPNVCAEKKSFVTSLKNIFVLKKNKNKRGEYLL